MSLYIVGFDAEGNRIATGREQVNHWTLNLYEKDGRTPHGNVLRAVRLLPKLMADMTEHGVVSSVMVPEEIAEATLARLANDIPPVGTEPEAPHWVSARKRPVVVRCYQTQERIEIETLEGVMIANPGDLVIEGVRGERYPCKPEIFHATYDVIGDDDGKERAEPRFAYWDGERLVPPSDPAWQKEACDRISNDSDQLIGTLTVSVKGGTWTKPPNHLHIKAPADITDIVESPLSMQRASDLYAERKTFKEVLAEAFGVEVQGDGLGWLDVRPDGIGAPAPAPDLDAVVAATENERKMFGKAMPAIFKLRAAVSNGLTAEQCAKVMENGYATFIADDEVDGAAFDLWSEGDKAMVVEWTIPDASREMKQAVLDLVR